MEQGHAIFGRLDADRSPEDKVGDGGGGLDSPNGVTGRCLLRGPERGLVEVRLEINVQAVFRIGSLLVIAADDGRLELDGLDLGAETDLDAVTASSQPGQRGPVELRDGLDRN